MSLLLILCLGAFGGLPVLAMRGSGQRRHYVALFLLGAVITVLGLVLAASASMKQANAEQAIVLSAGNNPQVQQLMARQREAASLRRKAETKEAMGIRVSAKAKRMLDELERDIETTLTQARQKSLEEARQAVRGTPDAPESYAEAANWCRSASWIGLSISLGSLLGVVLVKPKENGHN